MKTSMSYGVHTWIGFFVPWAVSTQAFSVHDSWRSLYTKTFVVTHAGERTFLLPDETTGRLFVLIAVCHRHEWYAQLDDCSGRKAVCQYCGLWTPRVDHLINYAYMDRKSIVAVP
jgi:hypothetical protein